MYIDNKGRLVLEEHHNKIIYISANHVRVVADNLKKGKVWPYCSPQFPITRDQAAFILSEVVYGR